MKTLNKFRIIEFDLKAINKKSEALTEKRDLQESSNLKIEKESTVCRRIGFDMARIFSSNYRLD